MDTEDKIIHPIQASKIQVSIEFMGQSIGRGKVEVTPGMTIKDLKLHLLSKTGKKFQLFVKQTFMPCLIARIQDLALCFGNKNSSNEWSLDIKASRQVTWG